MECISSRAGDNIDNSTHRSAKFRGVSGSFDLDFIDQLKNSALGLGTDVHIGGVSTVNIPHVFGSGSPID